MIQGQRGHESVLSTFKLIKDFGISPIVRKHPLLSDFFMLYMLSQDTQMKADNSSLKDSDCFSVSLFRSPIQVRFLGLW